MPDTVYQNLIRSFPNSRELSKYSSYRIDQIIGDYFDMIDDFKFNFENYLEKKNKKIPQSIQSNDSHSLINTLAEYETNKYKLILEKLKFLLIDSKTKEKDWQNQILEIITLIFPKYVHSFSEYQVLNKNDKRKRVDFFLLDIDNNVDIIEIKKAHDIKLLNSTTIRSNYSPSRDLSSTIMQVEKYLYYLNRYGDEAEKNLKDAIKKRESTNIDLKVRNPKGIIIMGRSNYFNEQQKEDYRIIKNSYSNIIDIYSYDELIDILERLIKKFEKSLDEFDLN